jgi:hypothetical protein
MKFSTAPFEVRCAHCNVSFPVESRVCVHCGRAIHSRDEGGVLEPIVESGWEGVGESPDPIDVMSNPVEREVEVSDKPSSTGRSLIRSLGGFIWVIVLIGFTLARTCGGE